jgi:ATP-dependent Zn protease
MLDSPSRKPIVAKTAVVSGTGLCLASNPSIAGCRAFLDECLDPGLQRIILLDASAAIGWEKIRQLESPLLDMMEVAISRAADAGRIAQRKPGPLAHFLYGALCETAMIVARANDQKAARRDAVGEIGRVLAGLAL